MTIGGVKLEVYHDWQIDDNSHEIKEISNARNIFDLYLEKPAYIDILLEDEPSEVEEQILKLIPSQQLDTGFYLIEYVIHESRGYFDIDPEIELEIKSIKPISEEKLRQTLLKEKIKERLNIKNQPKR